MDGKQVFRANHRVDRPVGDAAMHEFGDMQVHNRFERGSCFHSGALLSPEVRLALAFAP